MDDLHLLKEGLKYILSEKERKLIAVQSKDRDLQGLNKKLNHLIESREADAQLGNFDQLLDHG